MSFIDGIIHQIVSSPIANITIIGGGADNSTATVVVSVKLFGVAHKRPEASCLSFAPSVATHLHVVKSPQRNC
jgi:hypothetical protein